MTSQSNLRARIAAGDELVELRGDIGWSKDQLSAALGGGQYDFISRFFAPGAGIDEDPVTGSAHCALIPYWAERLGKTRLKARQISPRGGELSCELRAAGWLRGGPRIARCMWAGAISIAGKSAPHWLPVAWPARGVCRVRGRLPGGPARAGLCRESDDHH